MLRAAIYSPLSGKGAQAPSCFPEMKVQTSNSPNQQLPPAPWLDPQSSPRPRARPRDPPPRALLLPLTGQRGAEGARVLPAHLVDGDGRVDHHPPDDLGFVGYLGLPLLGWGHHRGLCDLSGRRDTAALRHLQEKERGEGNKHDLTRQPQTCTGHHRLCPPRLKAATSL